MGEALGKLRAGKALTRADQRLLKETGVRIGMQAESGIAYAARVAAEWEAQLVLAGFSIDQAKREAARLASDDLTVRQAQETTAGQTEIKPDGSRSYVAVQTTWETDLETGQMHPVSAAELAQDCGHDAPPPLADRARQNGYNKDRSVMEKIARTLAGKRGTKARQAAARTAEMGRLSAELEAAGKNGNVELHSVRPGRKPARQS